MGLMIAKLVYIASISMVYDPQTTIYSTDEVYKPTYNWGPHTVVKYDWLTLVVKSPWFMGKSCFQWISMIQWSIFQLAR